MSVPRPGGIRRRSYRWASAALLGAAASLAVVNPAAAAPVDVTGGSLDWGFKSSFRAYVSTGNGNPPIAVGDGATRNADGTFRFPATGGTYDSATGATTVNYGGTVVFSYPAHFFTITLTNPTVVVDGAGGSLLADVDLQVSGGGFEPVQIEQAAIATLGTGATSPTVAGETVSWSNLTTTLTETGAAAFAGFFTAGTALDPASVTFTTASGGGTPATPTVTVNPSAALDTEGATVTVTGSGFDPDANGGVGVYVAFGPKGDNHWTNSRPYKPVKWVHKNASSSAAQVKLDADGSFSTTLDLVPSYIDGNGDPVDCTVTQCYVLTFAAHASSDRSQDTFTPITFGGGTGAPSGAEQEITAQVLQSGPLTLTSAGNAVALSAVHPGAVAGGALNAVTVNDLRGTNAGWNVVGQVEDFTSALGGVIAADNLGWAPSASVLPDDLVGTPGVVTPGGRANPGDGLGSARTLCAAAAGASAGSFRCAADLDLGVPAATAPGDYAATLTLTLS
ncbi:HtaA domain-containing protein [Micromonospora radicis]|uniref:Htaa domain-containing protein n=1 Tax=Micromonospora radicis TaxID=1894971 RepID=A0A418MWR7_9ACTN|nr:HtaA domain-containing protein [Micromonospora radicis]RIV39117.1 Htaa domain-containing protein [Micromonospora radicis]